MPSALVQTTVRAVAEHVAGSTLVATSTGSAVALAREVMNAMNAFGLAAAGMAFLTAHQPRVSASTVPQFTGPAHDSFEEIGVQGSRFAFAPHAQLARVLLQQAQGH